MWKVWKLSQLPRLPSDVLRLRESGWTGDEVLDFDLGMLWFGDWIEAKKGEQVWVKHSDEHKGMSPKPKYETLGQVFELYDETRGMTKFAPQAVVPVFEIDAVIDDAFGDDILF